MGSQEEAVTTPNLIHPVTGNSVKKMLQRGKELVRLATQDKTSVNIDNPSTFGAQICNGTVPLNGKVPHQINEVKSIPITNRPSFQDVPLIKNELTNINSSLYDEITPQILEQCDEEIENNFRRSCRVNKTSQMLTIEDIFEQSDDNESLGSLFSSGSEDNYNPISSYSDEEFETPAKPKRRRKQRKQNVFPYEKNKSCLKHAEAPVIVEEVPTQLLNNGDDTLNNTTIEVQEEGQLMHQDPNCNKKRDEEAMMLTKMTGQEILML
ncbi:hypothetical protein J6590_054373 [Homalodisca vitripennis]|nr:hypothetical protein J6590_054373 [Homalodisca vitripennis]